MDWQWMSFDFFTYQNLSWSTYLTISSCQLHCKTTENDVCYAVKWRKWMIAGVIRSLHVLKFAEWISNRKMNQTQNGSKSDFCLACTKPVLFPWQPYQWLFGSRLQCTNQMTNQQRWFHHTSTEMPFIPAFVRVCVLCVSVHQDMPTVNQDRAKQLKPEC